MHDGTPINFYIPQGELNEDHMRRFSPQVSLTLLPKALHFYLLLRQGPFAFE